MGTGSGKVLGRELFVETQQAQCDQTSGQHGSWSRRIQMCSYWSSNQAGWKLSLDASSDTKVSIGTGSGPAEVSLSCVGVYPHVLPVVTELPCHVIEFPK